MIETSNPEIDLNQLVERVREEAARVGSEVATTRAPTERRLRRSPLPHLPELKAPPSVAFSRPMDPAKIRTNEKVENARGMIDVASWIPKIFRGMFRRQGGFNRAILDAVASLAKNNLQLNKRVRELTASAEQQNH